MNEARLRSAQELVEAADRSARRAERELRELYEFRLRRMERRFDVARNLMWVLTITAMALPVLAANYLFNYLDGRKTAISLSVPITIALLCVVGGAAVAVFRKTRLQSQELRRLRMALERRDAQFAARVSSTSRDRIPRDE
jgi:choline-glycine betaine transporter